MPIPLPLQLEETASSIIVALTGQELVELVLKLVIATVLGSLIAFHPQRLRRSDEINWDMIKSQILICNMGVILVPIIRESLALAFALAGLGSFIRFRAAVNNPLDGAIIFVQIMIGMACGHPDYGLAIAFTGFVFLLLFVLNIHAPRHQQLWEVKTQGGRPDAARRAFEALAGELNYRIERLNLNVERGTFVCRFRPPTGVAVPEIDRLFLEKLPEKPAAVQWNRRE